MFRSHLFIFHVLFLLALTNASSCRPLIDVALLEQRRFLSFQQRGLPRAFIKPFYSSFLKDLCEFTQERYGATSLPEICLTESDMNEFSGSYHDHYEIDDEVQLLKARFPHLAYLSRSRKVPDDDRFETESWDSFNETLHAMSTDDFCVASILPETVSVLYDPNRGKALQTYISHSSYAPTMSAAMLLKEVTGMVMSLELMKVPRESSIQILRHAVAWLSTVFRALQKDGPDVGVPVLFIPFYRHFAEELLKGSEGDSEVPLVDESVVEEEFGETLHVYSRLDVWGRLEVINWGDKYDVWTIERLLFDPAVLGRVAKKIGFEAYDPAGHTPYSAAARALRGKDMEREIAIPINLQDSFKNRHTIANRDASLCEEPLYEYVPRAVPTWEEKCCAAICCNVALMLQAGITKEECCGFCNQLDCAFENSPLEVLAVVHLEPYGGDMGGAVGVSL